MKIALSGCFDLFHDGHKNLLDFAANFNNEQGNTHILIALNSDESIKQLKGTNRPIDNCITRKINILEHMKKKLFVGRLKFEISEFSTEKELLKLYLAFEPDLILHGNDIKDVTKVTGHPHFPVLLIDRGFDSKGKRISTTQLIEELNVK